MKPKDGKRKQDCVWRYLTSLLKPSQQFCNHPSSFVVVLMLLLWPSYVVIFVLVIVVVVIVVEVIIVVVVVVVVIDVVDLGIVCICLFCKLWYNFFCRLCGGGGGSHRNSHHANLPSDTLSRHGSPSAGSRGICRWSCCVQHSWDALWLGLTVEPQLEQSMEDCYWNPIWILLEFYEISKSELFVSETCDAVCATYSYLSCTAIGAWDMSKMCLKRNTGSWTWQDP